MRITMLLLQVQLMGGGLNNKQYKEVEKGFNKLKTVIFMSNMIIYAHYILNILLFPVVSSNRLLLLSKQYILFL